MKARLVYLDNSYHLLLCTGKIKKLTKYEAQRFIETYDSELHYAGNTKWDYGGITMDDYSGETVARVLDNGNLVIEAPTHFRDLMDVRDVRYLSPIEYAEKVGRHRTLINQLCRDGRIPGAKKMGSRWLIPETAEYPGDARLGQRVKKLSDNRL